MKTLEIEIDGIQYVAHELPMSEVMPIMEQEPANLSVELVKYGVTVNGTPLGDDALELNIGKFNKLMRAVNEVNDIESAGND